MLECAPEAENGGNSRYTAGAIRFACDGVEDIRALCPDLPEEKITITDIRTNTTDQFLTICSDLPDTELTRRFASGW